MNWKIFVQKIFNKFGYRITKIRTGEKLSYTRNHPYSSYTYTPWFGEKFLELWNQVKDFTLVTEDRCYTLHLFAYHCSHLEGDFAECGVYKGGTSFLISDTLRNLNFEKKFHLFDTFEGMPESANKDKSHHKKGDYNDTSINSVKSYLDNFSFIEFHKGLIPETFADVRDKKFSFVHIDVDIFQSVYDCCSFFYERMVKGGIIIVDDYGFQGYELAAKKAIDEFFSQKIEKPVVLRNGECLIIKL